AQDARAVTLADVFVLARYVRSSDAGGTVSEDLLPTVRICLALDGGAALMRARAGISGVRTAASGASSPPSQDVRINTGRVSVPRAILTSAGGDDTLPDGDPHGATTPDAAGVSAAIVKLSRSDQFIVPGSEVGMPGVEDVRVRVTGGMRSDGVQWVA